MLRQSSIKKHFRKEIFNAPGLFTNKLKGPEFVQRKWQILNLKINIVKYSKNKMLPDYFEFFTTKVSSETKEKLKRDINENIFDKFNFNSDSNPQYIYLIIIIIGLELSQCEQIIKDRVLFETVINYHKDLKY